MIDLTKAQEVILDVIAKRKRWGKHLSSKDFSSEDLLDSLVSVHEHEANVGTAERAKLNRQLGASNARETKLKNGLEKAKAVSLEQSKRIDELKAAIGRLQAENARLMGAGE